jgi:PAS domain S-box-containing protein
MTPSRIYRQRTRLAGALGSIACLSAGCSTDVAPTGGNIVCAGIAAAAVTAAFLVHRSSKRLRRELEKHARELETSEERHRLLLAQASDAILVADADTGVIIEANRCASDLLGWEGSELVGHRHTTVHQNSERELVRRAFIEHGKRGGIVDEDTHILHRSGERIPVNARSTLVTAGARRYMQVILRDLRPRLRAEAALRQSETRLRELLEHAPVSIIEEDFTAPARWLESLRVQGIADISDYLKTHPQELTQQFSRIHIVSANPAALRAAGAPDLASYRSRLPASVTPSVLDAFRLELEAIWAGRTEVTCELTFLRSDGRLNYGVMHWSVNKIGDQPDLSRVVVAISDLTPLRTAEARLREVEDRWELAVRGINAGIFEQNYITGETYLSDRWKEIIGYLPHELPSNREAWQGRVHPDDRQRVLAAMHAHLRHEKKSYEIDYRIRCKDGTYKWIEARGRAVFSVNGQPLRLIGAHADISDRKAAEVALREGETRYRRLFEDNPCPMWVYDLETLRFLAVNPAAVRHYGYSEQEFLGMTIFEIRPPNEVERLRRALADWKDGQALPGLWVHRRKDGTLMLMNVTTHSHDFAGRPAVLTLVQDVTEQQAADQRLRASEARYRILFELSPVAIVEQDYGEVGAWLEKLRADGVVDLASHMDRHPEELARMLTSVKIVDTNRETLRMVRAASKEELVANIHRVFTPDAYAARKQTFLTLWAGKSEVEGEVTMLRLDGSPRRVFYRWWIPPSEEGRAISHAQIVLVDLTDIRTAEAELAAERERLRVTLRAMAEGLLTTDTEGIVQFMNEAAERMTGWTAGSAIGRHVDEVGQLRDEKNRATSPLPFRRAITEHRVVEFPLQSALIGRDGHACQVDGRCAPMHDLSGRAIGAVAVFRDVTERARLEAELLRSSKLESVGILAGGIAHDFNNILTVVMGNVTLAMLDSTVNDAVSRWLEEAERGVLRARDLTQQLLTFAKGGEPVRKTVRLPEVVREAAEFALHGSKVRCEFSVAPELWAAEVDKGQIGQVVQNLVINAVQAMPEGGVVRVSMNNEQTGRNGAPSLLAEGSYLRLSIADSGMGIRPDHLSRIFDPYFTTKQSGSGLGLATVYSIVRKHQGHIEVESELGKGTTFHIWLTAAPDAQPAQTETGGEIVKMSGRVLFMDDETTICVLAKALLTRLGFVVTTTPDGDAAVKAYKEAKAKGEPYRLVIMDLTVPGGMGGLEAMHELLAIDPEVTAIVSSGYSSDPVMANYRKHGFRGMVPKPYKITDLSRAIRSVLDEK